MNMYERIKSMTQDEMREFIYWVYMNGNKDGEMNLCDSPVCSYFGGAMLNYDVSEVMPNNNVNDLWNAFEGIYGKE